METLTFSLANKETQQKLGNCVLCTGALSSGHVVQHKQKEDISAHLKCLSNFFQTNSSVHNCSLKGKKIGRLPFDCLSLQAQLKDTVKLAEDEFAMIEEFKQQKIKKENFTDNFEEQLQELIKKIVKNENEQLKNSLMESIETSYGNSKLIETRNAELRAATTLIRELQEEVKKANQNSFILSLKIADMDPQTEQSPGRQQPAIITLLANAISSKIAPKFQGQIEKTIETAVVVLAFGVSVFIILKQMEKKLWDF